MKPKEAVKMSVKKFASELPTYVEIGAYRFPVVTITKEKTRLILQCDFTQDGLGQDRQRAALISLDGTEIVARPTNSVTGFSGIWLPEILHLVSQHPKSAPLITLCLENAEQTESRIVRVVREDNEDDETGGLLWLYVRGELSKVE